jgi:chromosome segregation ATPase
MGALAVTVGAFLLLVGGGFISSFWSLYRHNRPPVNSSEGNVSPAATKAEPQSADAGPVSFEELQSQIDELEEKIESNRFRLAEAEKARDRLHRSARTQNKDLEESAVTIRGLKDRIRGDAARLQILKRRMQEIERESE